MPSTEDDFRRMIEEEDAKSREEVERAIQLGGPPTEGDMSSLWDDLCTVHDRLEGLVWRIEGIAAAEGTKIELPFEITLAHLGVLAVMADDLRNRMDDFRKFEGRLRSGIGDLDTIRREYSHA